jgi:MFS family permease
MSAVEKAEARKRNIRQWKLLIGLLLPNFLASVDVTIVAPAIPLISSDFSPSLLTLHYHHALTDL